MMKNPIIDPEVRYLYLRDPWNEQRVLTIGRKLINGDQLFFTWCLNKVERSKIAHECQGYIPQDIVHDKFCKKTARHIVCRRMQRPDRRNLVWVVKGTKFIPSILRAILSAPHSKAKTGEPFIPNRVTDLVARILDPDKYPKPYASPKRDLFRLGAGNVPAKMIDESFTITRSTPGE